VTLRPAVDDWRRFGDPSFRVYHYLALAQGVVGVLAGFDVVIPFALAVGIPPFLAVLLGVVPLAGGMAQLVMPRLLDRTDGNLRGITILFAAISEPRGLYFALLVLLAASGIVVGPLAFVVLAALVAVTSIVSSVATSNLLSWYSAILPEPERRLVVPRMMAVSLGIGALLLIPMAAALDALSHQIGLMAYALPFLVSGTLGVVEVVVLFKLRHPGRVVVPPIALASDSDVAAAPDLARFLRVSGINALGMGFAPSMSVFMISVLGMSAGFSMMVGAIGTLTQVASAAISGSRLTRGSSEKMLRRSFGIRAMAMAAPLLAWPGTITAPFLMILTSMLGAIGFSSGQLAANERMFRLIRGPAVVRQHARYLARTSGAMTIGQLIGSGVIYVGMSAGYPAFALLYGISSAIRVVAYRDAAPRASIPETVPATVAVPEQLAGHETTAEAGATAVA
jgi:MFS family permease